MDPIEDLTIDHREFAGEEMPDPWADPDQKEWPMNEGGEEDGLGADDRSQDLAV